MNKNEDKLNICNIYQLDYEEIKRLFNLYDKMEEESCKSELKFAL